MQNLPHRYSVTAAATVAGDVELTSAALPSLRSAPPIEFGGPGTCWSPETLLVAAVTDCFVLTFRAVARASQLSWTALECQATGTLDRVDRTTQFTHFDIRVRLTVPAETDRERANRALEKAERGCLITSSLKGEVHLTTDVRAELGIACGAA
jgi:organic hydroperoxide reductase OsmC/OhrA